MSGTTQNEGLIGELTKIFGPERVKTDSATMETHGVDWTRYYQPNPRAIVFPKTAEEIVTLVHWARSNHMPLVPSGGRTGLSGGAVARQSEVVVSFDLMNQILEFDPLDLTVKVQPGVITEELQNFAAEKGLLFPVDFASRGSSQIGGNICTNAGGIKVVRYGLTRNWVTGLKVVTGKGDTLSLNQGLVKNATGYDLRHLFIGSEGTLGFITEATIQLAPKAHPTQLICLGAENLPDVMKVYSEFRNNFVLMAFEMFSDLALSKVLKSDSQASAPFTSRQNFYILIEVELHRANDEELLLGAFEKCMENGWISDGVISQSESQSRALWKLRENIAEACSPFTPYKNDISVTISKVPEFVKEADALLKKNYPTWEVVWFGHIGDGNLHISILKPEALPISEFVKSCQKVDELLFGLLKKFGGSISAEHGVGLSKKPFLHFTRSAEEIAILKSIKSIFDPDKIMNPGKIFD